MTTVQQLRSIWESAGERRGWDFSRLRVSRAPAPWVYEQVVRDDLSGTERVLDVGTGGGERLIKLADSYRSAIGIDIDPDMIAVARENLPESLSDKIEFKVANADSACLPDSSLDVVLNRHSVVAVPEVGRVLNNRGKFIWQSLGERNLASVVGPFGGQMLDPDQHPEAIRDSLVQDGFLIKRFDEYDVPYAFMDLESLIFQIKAIAHYLPVVPEFEAISETLVDVVESIRTTDGHYASNEHRWLLIAEAP